MDPRQTDDRDPSQDDGDPVPQDPTLPAALEDPGRADELTHGEDVHPSGARLDHRNSAPGTSVPRPSRD